MTPAGDERPVGAPEQLARQLEEVAANVGSVLYGKRDVVRLTLACLAAEGHLLIEDLPGVGKTTLAKIIAETTQASFIEFSAVLGGMKEIKQVMVDAEKASAFGSRTILFIDEIHRFNKAQQDAFLPYVERGTIRPVSYTHLDVYKRQTAHSAGSMIGAMPR